MYFFSQILKCASVGCWGFFVVVVVVVFVFFAFVVCVLPAATFTGVLLHQFSRFQKNDIIEYTG